MSVTYAAVAWNPQKKRQDLVLAAGVLAALASYAIVSVIVRPQLTVETVLIRGTALTAFLLLHVILSIGPLVRLDRRLLPLLYNRRHLGVCAFLLALAHGGLATFQFHALSDANPIASVITAYARDFAALLPGGPALGHVPFEPFGVLALGILFVMAATSHDFWLRNLGPSAWKLIHLGVFAAYGLLVTHVALGALQSERSVVPAVLVALGLVVVLGLHLAAARRERAIDRASAEARADGFAPALPVQDLREGVGRVAVVAGRRVAIFLEAGRVFAVSNACRHQGGPLGEGRIRDGCITCPWHGWQYRAADGCSPPPFQEVVETYRTRVVEGRVLVDPQARPLGEKQEGAPVEGGGPGDDAAFFIGWMARAPAALAARARTAGAILVVLAAVVGALLGASQGAQPDGRFEFSRTREVEGVLVAEPVLHLRLDVADAPADSADSPANLRGGLGGAACVVPPGRGATLVLVGEGKHGPPASLAQHDGARVRLRGKLAHAGGSAVLEVAASAEAEVLGPAGMTATRAGSLDLGDVEVTGELVDTKCWHGVMRPATGKVHRACAVRCLAGGVPPGLLLRREDGGAEVVYLAGPPGAALDLDPQLAARTLQVAGRLEEHDGIAVLRVHRFEVLGDTAAEESR